jgi:hypothetical protein
MTNALREPWLGPSPCKSESLADLMPPLARTIWSRANHLAKAENAAIELNHRSVSSVKTNAI